MSSETSPPAPAPASAGAPTEKATKEGRAVDRELLDFNLSKTYEAWRESQKTLSAAFISHVVFLSLAAVLLWGEGIEQRINVPVLSLSIDRRSASVWMLVLSGVTLYWFSITHFYFKLVSSKVRSWLSNPPPSGALNCSLIRL